MDRRQSKLRTFRCPHTRWFALTLYPLACSEDPHLAPMPRSRLVTREPGSERTDLPIWAPTPHVVPFATAGWGPVKRSDVPGVPGAFVLSNVLSEAECDAIAALSDAMGYTEDAPVSLGRRIRRNENCVIIADDSMWRPIWQRVRPFMPASVEHSMGACQTALGLNQRCARRHDCPAERPSRHPLSRTTPRARLRPLRWLLHPPPSRPSLSQLFHSCCLARGRWRLYRYGPEDVFHMHTDGSWPGSGLDGSGRLVRDLFGDRWSQLCAPEPPRPRVAHTAHSQLCAPATTMGGTQSSRCQSPRARMHQGPWVARVRRQRLVSGVAAKAPRCWPLRRACAC